MSGNNNTWIGHHCRFGTRYADQCPKMYDPNYAGYWLIDNQTGIPYNEPVESATMQRMCLPPQDVSNLAQAQFFVRAS
jgi:hypothetical protein